jgi:hypothetical protein
MRESVIDRSGYGPCPSARGAPASSGRLGDLCSPQDGSFARRELQDTEAAVDRTGSPGGPSFAGLRYVHASLAFERLEKYYNGRGTEPRSRNPPRRTIWPWLFTWKLQKLPGRLQITPWEVLKRPRKIPGCSYTRNTPAGPHSRPSQSNSRPSPSKSRPSPSKNRAKNRGSKDSSTQFITSTNNGIMTRSIASGRPTSSAKHPKNFTTLYLLRAAELEFSHSILIFSPSLLFRPVKGVPLLTMNLASTP